MAAAEDAEEAMTDGCQIARVRSAVTGQLWLNLRVCFAIDRRGEAEAINQSSKCACVQFNSDTLSMTARSFKQRIPLPLQLQLR